MSRLLSLIAGLALCGAATAAGVDFSLTGLDGRQHRLSDYRGKWVVVNYWATWCPPCLEEMPELVHFHERHKEKDAVVLGVNMEDIPAAELKRFVEENMVTYPILRSRSGMTALGPIPGLPTTYLVAPDGSVTASKLGALTAQDIEAFIAAQKSAR